MSQTSHYSSTRYTFDSKRRITWEEISRYLEEVLPSLRDGRMLELGCGYGDWLGNMPAKEKVAIELDETLAKHARATYGLEVMKGDALSLLSGLEDKTYDAVLASNFFEHFEVENIQALLSQVRRTLKQDGVLIVIQPNFRYCASRYFDDYTHRSIHSHVSFADLLSSQGYQLVRGEPRFLPFSFKSRLPVNRLLVRTYLHSPIRPMAAQFLMCAKPM